MTNLPSYGFRTFRKIKCRVFVGSFTVHAKFTFRINRTDTTEPSTDRVAGKSEIFPTGPGFPSCTIWADNILRSNTVAHCSATVLQSRSRRYAHFGHVSIVWIKSKIIWNRKKFKKYIFFCSKIDKTINVLRD